jgi:acyl-CoA thioesterase I
VKVIAMGDSITEGQYCDVSWPDFLDAAHVVNRGVSNDTTRMMLERFPTDVQKHGADVVVLQAGHNDANRWETDRGLPRVSPDAYGANLREMVDRCRAFGATPVLCTITPTRTTDAYAEDVEFYNAILESVARTHDVVIADVRSVFDDHDLEMLLLSDGLHLSAEGHELYAQCVQKALAPLAVFA